MAEENNQSVKPLKVAPPIQTQTSKSNPSTPKSYAIRSTPTTPTHTAISPFRRKHKNAKKSKKHERSQSDYLSQLKSKKYRNSIDTESPFVMLTPPNPEEVKREERRLSIGSIVSNNNNDDDSENDQHLVPPKEPEPEEVVKILIHNRRPSTITTLSQVIKEIFINKKIKEDGIPALILDKGLYLGSIGAAKNLEWLKSNGITHVLCVAGGIGECYPKQFIYKVIDINDAPHENISGYFNDCYNFINDALYKSHGKVLVHCFAGMSRSVTVVSAYLMQKKRMYAVPALKFVKKKRTVANPNAGFIVQLIKYQTKLGLKQRSKSIESREDTLTPSASDNEDHDEEKADKPKKPSFKGLAGRLHKKMNVLHDMQVTAKKENDTNDTNETKDEPDKIDHDKNKKKKSEDKFNKYLNSPMVKEWETGRRPSLFTAIAKLRLMKHRSRADSTGSNHSGLSSGDKSDGSSEHKDNLNPGSGNTLKVNNNKLSPKHASTSPKNKIMSSPNGNPGDGKPLSMYGMLKTMNTGILKEVSNESDEDNILKEAKNIIATDTNHRFDSGDDDPITPLETINDAAFPQTEKL